MSEQPALAWSRRIQRVFVVHGLSSSMELIPLVQCSMYRKGRLIARETVWRGRVFWSLTEPYFSVRSLGTTSDSGSLVDAYEGTFWVNVPVGVRAQQKEQKVTRIVYASIPLLLEVRHRAPIRIPIQDVYMDIRVIQRRVLTRQTGSFMDTVNIIGWVIAFFMVLLAIWVHFVQRAP